MPKFRTLQGSYDLPHFHSWKSRGKDFECKYTPILSKHSRVATIGSCFASELANAMERWGLNGSMHPAGLFYNTHSMRQEIERAYGGWKEKDLEPYWRIRKGHISPFSHPTNIFKKPEDLAAWEAEIDIKTAKLFRSADVIVVTLGLIETWRQPRTGNCYRYIPHPEVFKKSGVEFHRLTVAEMKSDLGRMRKAIKRHSSAEIIFTESPIPLHVTMSDGDIRVANAESKGRIRAALSEFIETCDDVFYFHSYELVTAATSVSDFMKSDGRHVHEHAVNYILQQFLKQFADESIKVPEVDTSWLSD